MDALKRLRKTMKARLEQTRQMIDEYDEAMDYATHCSLQGFAEGLAFALEEVENILEGKPDLKKKRPDPKKGK
jgi:hypothetical protein